MRQNSTTAIKDFKNFQLEKTRDFSLKEEVRSRRGQWKEATAR